MKLQNLAQYRRYLWEAPNLLVVVGEIGPVLEGYKVYNGRYGIKGAEPEDHYTLERLFAAVGLAAVWLAEPESWGWTVTLPGSLLGFFSGVEPEGMICCRVREADAANQVVVVQRQKAGHAMMQSHFESLGNDPARAVQQYFEKVEQSRTRLAVSPDGRGVLAHALPGGRFEEVESLAEDELIELMYQMAGRGELKQIGEVVLFYECRCHDEMILKMIEDLQEERHRDLWGDLQELEIECPRCGRAYVVRKKEMSK